MTADEVVRGRRVMVRGLNVRIDREAVIISDAPFSCGDYGMCVKIDFVDGTGEWIWTLGRLELIERDNKPLPLPG